MTDREVLLGCTQVRTKCTEKISVGLWGQSRDPRELPDVTSVGPGVARLLHLSGSLCRVHVKIDITGGSKPS